MPGAAAEGVPPEAARASPPGDALRWLARSAEHGEEKMGLTEMVQHLHSALIAVAEEQRSVQARVQALETAEAGMKQDLTRAVVTTNEAGENVEAVAAQLAALEKSVEASMEENLERDLAASDEMLGWNDDLQSIERRLERLEAPERPTVASADDGSAAPEASKLAAVELRLASTEVQMINQGVDLERKLDENTAKLEELEQRLATAQPSAPADGADPIAVVAESVAAGLDAKLAEIRSSTSEQVSASVAQLQRAIDAVDADVRTAVVAEFSGAMREMSTLSESLAQRIDQSTQLSEAVSASVRAVEESAGAAGLAQERSIDELRQRMESSIKALKGQHLSVAGDLSKEMDALSRSVTSQLETLKRSSTTLSLSSGNGGSSAGARAAAILSGAQHRRLKAELGGSVSSLEARLTQCEQQLLGGDHCWISVRDTSIEAFENEGEMKLIVLRSGANLGEEMSVDYATVDQTATAGKDYTSTRGRLVFGPYVTELAITVPLIDDTEWEKDETFLIKLSNPLCASAAGSGLEPPLIQEGWDSCVVTIIDDDEPDVSELEAAVAELEQQIAEASAAGKPTGPVEEILQEVRLELAAVRSGNGPR